MLPCDAKKNYNPCAVYVNKQGGHGPAGGGRFSQNTYGGMRAQPTRGGGAAVQVGFFQKNLKKI